MSRVLVIALLSTGCGAITPYVFDTETDDASDTDVAGATDTEDTTDDTDITWTDSDAGSTDTDEEPGPVGTSDDPFIVEVMDGTAAPKLRYVEIYNPTTGPLNLGGWKLNHVLNGVAADTETYTFPSVEIAAGRTFVVCFDEGAADFIDAFPGKSCDDTSPRVRGNGNDPYVLNSPSNSVKDVYGAFSGDGTGTAWEYTDSVAKRKVAVGSGSLSWTASEWTITAGQGAANPGARD